MSNRAKTAAYVIGIAAVLVGAMHGIFELQQGSVTTPGIFINARGGDCQPNCFPAMTVLPDFLSAGVLTVVVAIVLLLWVVARTGKDFDAPGIVLLSLLLLASGGGFLPPVLGFIAAGAAWYAKRQPSPT